jgi:hypothetical protein
MQFLNNNFFIDYNEKDHVKNYKGVFIMKKYLPVAVTILGLSLIAGPTLADHKSRLTCKTLSSGHKMCTKTVLKHRTVMLKPQHRTVLVKRVTVVRPVAQTVLVRTVRTAYVAPLRHTVIVAPRYGYLTDYRLGYRTNWLGYHRLGYRSSIGYVGAPYVRTYYSGAPLGVYRTRVLYSAPVLYRAPVRTYRTTVVAAPAPVVVSAPTIRASYNNWHAPVIQSRWSGRTRVVGFPVHGPTGLAVLPASTAQFAGMDLNGDGRIQGSELRAHGAVAIDPATGRMSIPNRSRVVSPSAIGGVGYTNQFGEPVLQHATFHNSRF